MFKSLWRRVFNNPNIFEAVRNIMNRQMISRIEKRVYLDGKSIIDVGCGTGTYSVLAKGPYLGVDLNARFILFARKKYGGRRHKFEVKDATTYTPKKKFDTSFFFSMLHHFSDAENDRILRQLARISKEVIIIDLIRPRNNLLKAFIVDLDRGDHVRPLKEQRHIITKHLVIRQEKIFDVLTARHSLFICEPKTR